MWYTEHKKYDHGVPGLLIFKNQRTNTIGEQEIHVLSKHSKLSVGIRHPLAKFFVLAPNQCNSGTHVYIIGLYKKPKGTLGQKFFNARCVDFFNSLDISVDIITAFSASEIRL